MIQINLQFETGAEARKALEELLGVGNTSIKGEDVSVYLKEIQNRIEGEKSAENFEAPKTETPAEETQPKKRRTKAEIEAEKAVVAVAETVEEEKDIQSEEPAKEEPKASAITKEMLQKKAVDLIRNGKKDQVTATIKSFGADSISQVDKNPVKAESYGALMDAFNAIV